jgi:hypothetical protein
MLTFCSAEDRAGAEIGLKLLILSVAEHCPDVPLVLYRPDPLPSFVTWTRKFPQIRLVEQPLPGAHQWNCKPQALLPQLAGPDAEAVWLDSDLMLTRDPRPLFERLSPETLGITQEPPSQPNQGSRDRTLAWRMPVGRELPQTLNSCVLRVTRHHEALLVRWRELLERPDYVAIQARTVAERPVAMASDQDVLNALLGSTEFAGIPLGVFANGRDIIHSGGALAYSFGERLRGLFLPRPTILHAISVKPWMILQPDRLLPGRQAWFRRLMHEVSPYLAYARRYRNQVDEPCPWMDWHTPLGAVLRMAGFGHWALRGLPVTLAATVMKRGGLA